MSDKAELILTQIYNLLNSNKLALGLLNVYRDRGAMEADVLPAAVVLDGRAQMVTEIAQLKSRDGGMPPAFFDLIPQVWIALKPRDTVANLTLNGGAAPIGPDLDIYREAVNSAILNDSTLKSYVAPDGYMALESWETDMAIGSSLVGNIMLQYRFRYVFIPPRA